VRIGSRKQSTISIEYVDGSQCASNRFRFARAATEFGPSPAT